MTNGVEERTNERARGFSAARVWVMASRPGTLSLSLSPVITGVAIGWADAGRVRWTAAFVAALAAALIQIGTNLYNDAADSRRGGDGAARVGPPRATASGLMDAGRVGRAAALRFRGRGGGGTLSRDRGRLADPRPWRRVDRLRMGLFGGAGTDCLHAVRGGFRPGVLRHRRCHGNCLAGVGRRRSRRLAGRDLAWTVRVGGSACE